MKFQSISLVLRILVLGMKVSDALFCVRLMIIYTNAAFHLPKHPGLHSVV